MASPLITILCPSKRLVVTALAGEQAPTVTGGRGGWQIIARPRRTAITDWNGTEPYRMTVSLLFDGYGDDRSVEADLKFLEEMAVDRRSRTGPPKVKVTGAIPKPGREWVIEDLADGSSVLWGENGRVRQDVTVTLLEYVASDLVALSSPTERAREAQSDQVASVRADAARADARARSNFELAAARARARARGAR